MTIYVIPVFLIIPIHIPQLPPVLLKKELVLLICNLELAYRKTAEFNLMQRLAILLQIIGKRSMNPTFQALL